MPDDQRRKNDICRIRMTKQKGDFVTEHFLQIGYDKAIKNNTYYRRGGNEYVRNAY